MKKILLSISALAIAFCSFGQYKEVKEPITIKTMTPDGISYKEAPKNKDIYKKRTRGSRYYSYVDAINEVAHAGSNTFGSTALPIWQDSTIIVNYTSGPGAINFSSVAAAINPSNAYFNDPTAYAGQMHIDANQPYTVDSLYLTGYYLNPNNTGAQVGDKLVFSVVLTTPDNVSFWQINQSYALQPSGTVKTVYLDPTATADTVMRGIAPNADSVARIGGYPTVARTTWDYTLTNADTSMISGGFISYKRFATAPPSPIAVAAGEIAVVSVTFVAKANSWIPNVDSISGNPGSKPHFRARFLEETAGEPETYRNFSENPGGAHFNNSSLMFSTTHNRYLPSSLFEAFNSKAFSYEHLDIDWVLNCNACGSVAVNDITKLEGVSVYPNPSTGVVNISLDNNLLNKDIDVTVLDLSGKTIYNESFTGSSSVKSFDLKNTAKGIYMYTVKSEGKVAHGKLVIE